MTKAIRFDKAGGPEVMKWVDVDVGAPGKGEIRVKHHAVGLNFIDVYFRTGLYPMPLPGGLGMEAAGEVTAVGEGITQFKPGDRVAYASRPPGAYAEERVMSADYVVKLPDSIGYEDAASIMLQGLTAQYLLRRTYRVKAGDTVLIPPGVKHWHGAAPDRLFSHLAMSENGPNGEGTAWLEAVSDSDYRAAPAG